jgi:prophage antirepressor-like protein
LGMRTSALLQRVPDDEVISHDLIDAMGRTQQTKFLSEAGMYRALLRSDKKQAEPFMRWVTREVLPSIRKQGFYLSEQLKIELANKDRELVRKEQVILQLQATKKKRTSEGYVLVAHEEPCFEGHIPKTTYEKVPATEVSDEQRKEILIAHNAKIVAGIIKNTIEAVGIRAAFEAFYNVFKEFLPK